MAKGIKCHLWCYSITGNVYDRGIFNSKAAAMKEAKDSFWHGYRLKIIKD